MKIAATLLAAALCAGCAVGSGTDQASDTPRRDLAGRPVPVGSAPARPGATAGAYPGAPAVPAPTRPPSDPGATASDAARGAGSGAGQTATARGSAAWRTFLTVADQTGDAGIGAPAYGDLVDVTLDDDGVRVRATVTLAGALPARTTTGESLGIGVDLYPSKAQRESDYQLFADGEPNGWFAYLQTPRGFIRYPGTISVADNRIVFTLPWSALGSPQQGRVSGFVDWTRKTSDLTGNPSSNDYAPVAGTAVYTR